VCVVETKSYQREDTETIERVKEVICGLRISSWSFKSTSCQLEVPKGFETIPNDYCVFNGES